MAGGLPSPVRQRRRAGGREPAAGHGDRLPELGRGRCAADGPPGAPGLAGVAGRRHRAARRRRAWGASTASRSACARAPRHRSSTSSASSDTSRRASPTPRRRRARPSTLDGFLFDAKVGFCQQYSGAMALLLRMGGVPARVAAGFTTGALDRTENEYVVRDLDAHSWVEVWFPSFGWVTRDPTPSAAPPRVPARRRQRGRRRARAEHPGPGRGSHDGVLARRARDGGRRGAGRVDRRRRGAGRARRARRRCWSAGAAGGCRRPRSGRWPSSSGRCAARATTAARA